MKRFRNIITLLAVMAVVFTSAPAFIGELDACAATPKKPAQVQKLKVTAKTTSSISLKWNKVKTKGVKGYAIYRYNAKTKKWSILKKVNSKTLTFKNTKLKANTTYKYKVKAYTSYKQYYNTKTKKWDNKKPAKKNWKTKKTRTKYLYSKKFSNTISVKTKSKTSSGTSSGGSSSSGSTRKYKYKNLIEFVTANNYDISSITGKLNEAVYRGPVYYYKDKSQAGVARSIYNAFIKGDEFVIDIEAKSPSELYNKIRDLNTLISQNNKYRIKPFADQNETFTVEISDYQARDHFNTEKGGKFLTRFANSYYGNGVVFAPHNNGHYRVRIPSYYSSTYKSTVNAVPEIYSMRNKQREYDESKYGNYFISHICSDRSLGERARISWPNTDEWGRINYNAVKQYIKWNYKMSSPVTCSDGYVNYPSYLEARYSSEDAYVGGLYGIATNRYGDVGGQGRKPDTVASGFDRTAYFQDIGWRTVSELYKRMYQTKTWEAFNNLTVEQKVILLAPEAMLHPSQDNYANSESYGYVYCASKDPAIRNRYTITWGKRGDSRDQIIDKMADPTKYATGVCSDIATVYGIIYRSVGAHTYFVNLKGQNHAILMIKAQDKTGKNVYYMLNNECLSYIGKESHIPKDYLGSVKRAMGNNYPF